MSWLDCAIATLADRPRLDQLIGRWRKSVASRRAMATEVRTRSIEAAMASLRVARSGRSREFSEFSVHGYPLSS